MLPKLHSREDVLQATGKYRVAWRNGHRDRGPCSDREGSRSRQQGEVEDRKELEGPGSWRQGTEEDHLGDLHLRSSLCGMDGKGVRMLLRKPGLSIEISEAGNPSWLQSSNGASQPVSLDSAPG